VEIKSGRGPEHFPTLADVEALRADGYFAKAARRVSGSDGGVAALREQLQGLRSDLRTWAAYARR
jgi:hypothetical protein